MLRINPQILTILRHRFDEQVTESDILSWLYNFEEEDWQIAMTVLNHISFYSESRCADILEDGIRRIIKEFGDMPIAISPIGGIGKSGGVMAYHIKKLMGAFRHVSWGFVDTSFMFEKTPYVVILLDDFLGSGKSASNLLDNIKESVPCDSIFVCLCVAYMQKAEYALLKKNVRIYGERHLPAFVRRGSVFGYPPRMKEVRDFAVKYGNLLYSKKTYKEGMDLYIGPLGYANCQSLVCFDHTTPNNTLPIIWESKKRIDNGKKWIPLFPRRLYDRTQRDYRYERMKYKWISIAIKISGGSITRLFNDFSYSSIQMIGLLHGKYHKRSDSYICSLLEISYIDYEKLCDDAVKKGILNEEGGLTCSGVKIYTNIRKKEFDVNPMIEELIEQKPNIYLPQKFLGFSRV